MNRANSAQTTATIGSPAASQGQIYKDICFSAKEAHLERHPIIIRPQREALPEQNSYRSSLWPHRSTSTNPTQLLNPSETAGVSEGVSEQAAAAAAATMGQRQGNHGREGGRRRRVGRSARP